MKKKTAGFSSLMGILAAASGILAPRAHAVAWCPTASDYTISCNGCSRELNCNTYNVSIVITGSDVTLHGMAHTMYDPPGAGIKVFKPGATIRSMVIRSAGWSVPATEGHGIYIVGSTNGAATKVENIIVDRSRGHGIWNASVNTLTITDGHFYNNGGHGVFGGGSLAAQLFHSSASANASHGYVTTGWGPWAYKSFFERNGSYGMYSNGQSDLLIEGNTFKYNYRGLFLSNAIAPTVTYNKGSGNTAIDCFDSGSTNGIHNGNVWGTASGTNCTP